MSDERERDRGRLDEAIDVVMGIIALRAPKESDESFVELLSAHKLKAVDRLVPLLERRSKLLGLDAPVGKEAPDGPGTLAAVERRLGVANGVGRA